MPERLLWQHALRKCKDYYQNSLQPQPCFPVQMFWWLPTVFQNAPVAIPTRSFILKKVLVRTKYCYERLEAAKMCFSCRASWKERAFLVVSARRTWTSFSLNWWILRRFCSSRRFFERTTYYWLDHAATNTPRDWAKHSHWSVTETYRKLWKENTCIQIKTCARKHVLLVHIMT